MSCNLLFYKIKYARTDSPWTRNAYTVTNHLQFCMMAASLAWIYAEHLRPNPQRRHKVKGRT